MPVGGRRNRTVMCLIPIGPEQPDWNLAGRRVEVWCVKTRADEGDLALLQSTLSADERERAARFRLAQHRDPFIVARGCLRLLLGRYAGCPPAEIGFQYGPRGKPSLPGFTIHFNLSHSSDLALFVFTRAGELGVDVERIHPIPEMMNLAGRFFCPAEAHDLASLADDQREHAFFLCWTRKEACIKATGNGLSTPLSSFRVSLQPGAQARFLHFEGEAADSWSLDNLDLPAGYVGALAYRDQPRPVLLSQILNPQRLLKLVA